MTLFNRQDTQLNRMVKQLDSDLESIRTADVPAASASWTPLQATPEFLKHPFVWLEAGLANYLTDAGTTPSNGGDQVGKVANWGESPFSVIQTGITNRPILRRRMSGGRLFWSLNTEGNDLLFGTFSSSITQPFTIFVVAKLAGGFENDGIDYYLLDSNDSVNRMVLSKNASDTPDKFRVYFGASFSGPAMDSNWNIWAVRADGTTSKLWINGGTPTIGNGGAHNPTSIVVGARFDGTLPWKGDIATVLIYNWELPIADVNRVGEYLQRVYGVAWTEATE